MILVDIENKNTLRQKIDQNFDFVQTIDENETYIQMDYIQCCSRDNSLG
jgi:hypothetical protein